MFLKRHSSEITLIGWKIVLPELLSVVFVHLCALSLWDTYTRPWRNDVLIEQKVKLVFGSGVSALCPHSLCEKMMTANGNAYQIFPSHLITMLMICDHCWTECSSITVSASGLTV